MDPKSSNQLPSVRTFARDLEKKRATGVILSEAPEKAAAARIATPKVIPEDPANRKYQAPTWTGNKNQPVPKKEVAAVVEAPRPEKKEEMLKPISAPKPKPATDSNIVVKADNEDAATATIIRDTKKDRFRLVPAVFSSMGMWFKDQQRKREIKKTPKYTVPDATRRKGVIQKATSHTGKIASFDYPTIQERIKQREERVAPKRPGFTWTPNTEPSQPLLEAPEPVTPKRSPITNVTVTPRKSITTPKATLPPVPPKVTLAPSAEIQLPLPAHLQTEGKTALREATKADEPQPSYPATPVPTTFAREELPTNVRVSEPETILPEEIPVETTTATKPQSLRDWLFVVNTNTIAMALAGLVFATGIFGVAVFFWFADDETTLQVSVSTPISPSPIDAPLQLLTVADPLTGPSLIDLIQKNNQANSLEVLQAILVTNSEKQDLVPSEAIITALGFELDSAFTQAISHTYFGSVNKTEPFILFKVTDANTALGSLLIWEDSMYVDTSLVLQKDSDLDSTTINTATFSDAVINREDVRLLKTLSGTELLIYGIVDRNTIIITTSSSAFSALRALKK